MQKNLQRLNRLKKKSTRKLEDIEPNQVKTRANKTKRKETHASCTQFNKPIKNKL